MVPAVDPDPGASRAGAVGVVARPADEVYIGSGRLVSGPEPMPSPFMVGWVAEPTHWSELRPGDVLEGSAGVLDMVAELGAVQGRRWLACKRGVLDRWAPVGDDDPLAMKLVRRDVLVGEVISDG